MADLTLQTNFKFQKSTAQPMGGAPSFNGLTLGDKAIENKINVAGTDITLDLGNLSAIGSFFVFNLATEGPPPAVDPVITQFGTSGTTQFEYLLVFHYSDGSLSVSNAVDTFLANDTTLDGSNYNILTWTNPSGVTSVDVYRIYSGGTPFTLGKIATAATSPYHDIGGAGNGADTPIVINSKFPLVYGPTSGTYPLLLEAGRWGEGQWNAAAMHFKAVAGPLVANTNLQYILVEP